MWEMTGRSMLALTFFLCTVAHSATQLHTTVWITVSELKTHQAWRTGAVDPLPSSSKL